ncbi:anti-sigma factor antagonist [Streptomyces sp. WAC 06783]|uniref:STAS domain-containing protein n=1 Tax=Streptomyces sp. WAC 06783 TaxID=2203211 RepID=UPI000F73B91E|nr:anti-sigma factor antagonist [Streptomyces sp. WAC 06783]
MSQVPHLPPGVGAEREGPDVTAVSGPDLSPAYEVHVLCTGERTGVTLGGELDLSSCRLIEPGLYDALQRTVRHLDLHLDAVPFCDFAGLNMLLRLRLRALVHNKTVTIASRSPAIERLLEVTDARNCSPPRPANSERPPAPTPTARTPRTRGPPRTCPRRSRTCAVPCRPARPSTWPAAS